MDKRQAKQQRIENILLSLRKFDYLTRSQIQTIHDLKSERNANRFLNSMSEYLSSFFHEKEKVYYLNKAGRDRVGCEKIRKKTPQIQHFLLRNQMWLYMRKPSSWDNEYKITVKDISVICDAVFTWKGKEAMEHIFVEIDVSQPMAANKNKINRYKKIKELTGNNFHLLWVTELESRRPKLNELMNGLPGKVFTLNEIK